MTTPISASVTPKPTLALQNMPQHRLGSSEALLLVPSPHLGGPHTSDGGGALSTMGVGGGQGLEPRFSDTFTVGVMHKVNSRDDAKPVTTGKQRRAI